MTTRQGAQLPPPAGRSSKFADHAAPVARWPARGALHWNCRGNRTRRFG